MGFFETAILEPSNVRPVLLDFWAPWCGPCRTLGPVLDRVAAANSDRFTLVKVNIDEHQDIATRFRVSSIPAVKLFDRGKVVGEFVGALPEREVRAWLDRTLPTADMLALAAARAALRAGDRKAALAALRGQVHEDSSSSEGRALYATLAYFEHPEHALALAATVRDGDPGSELASAVRELDAISRTTSVQGKPEAVEAYMQGIACFKAARFAEAAAAWIASLKSSRAVADDGAKRGLIALFNLLGEHDPVTLEYRRALASALY